MIRGSKTRKSAVMATMLVACGEDEALAAKTVERILSEPVG